MTLSERLADQSAGLTVDKLSQETRESARLHLLDLIGLLLLGRRDPAAQAMAGYAASVAGGGDMAPPLAGFVAAGAIHSTHLDCFHEPTRIHPGAPVAPALLALAAGRRASGADLLAALVAGWDVCCRLGRGAPNRILHRRGWHPTSLTGAFGAAAGAARLLGLSARQAADALGIAGTQPPGSFEFDKAGWSKPLQVGWAAQTGVAAALLAARGFPGPPAILDGPLGFYFAHCGEGNFNLAAVDAGLGESWAIDETSFISGTHFTDNLPAAAAAIAALAKLGAAPAEITHIQVEVPPSTYNRTAHPEAEHRSPDGVRTARVSLFWSVAIALSRQPGHGAADTCHDAYADDLLQNPLIRRLAAAVSVQAVDGLGPGPNPARVTVAAGGRQATAQVPTAPGDARWPGARLDRSVLEQRFHQHAAGLGDADRRRVLDLIWQLEDVPDVRPLGRLLSL